jgi:hypothetical protein
VQRRGCGTKDHLLLRTGSRSSADIVADNSLELASITSCVHFRTPLIGT